jgi:hypothetical protein
LAIGPRLHIPTALLLAALVLVLAGPARADAPLPYASLAPVDGDRFEQTATYGIPFEVTGAPAMAPVYILVSRSPSMARAQAVDFFGLAADLAQPGTYRGISKVGGWANVPGTYWWQARTGTASGPVRRIVIAPRSQPLPMLRRAEGRRAALRHLRGEFASYRRGSARRMRCGRVSRVHVRCRVSWRFRDLRYAGRVEITAESSEELLAVARIRRSARR